MRSSRAYVAALVSALGTAGPTHAQQITIAGRPSRIAIRPAGLGAIRLTITPLAYRGGAPFSPAVADRRYPGATLRLTELSAPVKRRVGGLDVEVRPVPLSVTVRETSYVPVE